MFKISQNPILNKIGIELLFIVISFGIAVLILIPVHTHIGLNYDFFKSNYIAIITFITCVRYIFLLGLTPFSHSKWIKASLIFLVIPVILFFVDRQSDFHLMLDEEGLDSLVSIPDPQKRWSIAEYTKYQYLFFSVSAIISLAILPIRMIVSLWRQVNKGTI